MVFPALVKALHGWDGWPMVTMDGITALSPWKRRFILYSFSPSGASTEAPKRRFLITMIPRLFICEVLFKEGAEESIVFSP